MATGSLVLLPGAATFPDGSTSNVAAGLTRRQGTNANPKRHFLTLDYDGAGTVAEHAWFPFRMPADYASGGTLKLEWQANATTGDCRWQASVGAVTAGDADTFMEHAQAAAATVTTTVNATEARRVNTSSITLTMDSAAAGDVVSICVFRDPLDAADTMTVDAELIAAVFEYTTS